MELFKEPDYDAIQILYGFILLALAVVLATYMFGNIHMLTAVVCLLLIKDGFPNFIIGAMKIGKPKEKQE